MNKTITLKNIKIMEIVIQPNNPDVAMSITYEILDENDKRVFVKQSTVKRDEFAAGGQNAIAIFAAKILLKIKKAEGF